MPHCMFKTTVAECTTVEYFVDNFFLPQRQNRAFYSDGSEQTSDCAGGPVPLRHDCLQAGHLLD